MKKLLYLIVLIAIGFTACDDDDSVDLSGVSAEFVLPKSIADNDAFLKEGKLTLSNVNTGYSLEIPLQSLALPAINVEYGVYNIQLEGQLTYLTENSNGKSVNRTETIRALKENYEIREASPKLNLELFIVRENTGFVISEIFFAGTKTPDGTQYDRDKFIELYNNSSEVLYADGLCVAESEFTTNDFQKDLTPNTISTHTAVRAVYRIPGNGKEHPVQPGETVLLCDMPINHITENANSLDLTGADFEWFDGQDLDSDVQEVANMIKLVSTLKSFWPLHNRGFTSYILFRMDDVTPEQFTQNYSYHYEYVFEFGGNAYPMDGDCWEVPNDCILDAVECSTVSEFQWKVLDPSLDISWTYSGDGDDARYGKSVKRKVKSTEEGGRKVLMDTNDSKNDFIATAENPSPGKIE
ncbi:MAG: DUF4876 domain-containing protein [Carboxylicivirga sp.]|jgi:hypothetical protein|nr:DUF4876 domain-containing protein [Carboxylicivirga sp.]